MAKGTPSFCRARARRFHDETMSKGMADKLDRVEEVAAKAEKEVRQDRKEAIRERQLQDALEDDEIREALNLLHAQTPKEQAGLD